MQTDTHQVLADPIQSKLRANHCYYVIARPCFVEAAHKGQIKGEAKAIRVPRGKNDKIPPQAFSFHTEVRRVLVEPGMRIVGEAAWRSCRQLQVVHLPDTVVSLLHGAFSRRRVLRVVTALTANTSALRSSRSVFFHEYGRRVGMVPRSSLKEGKNSQMVEKRTRTPKPTKQTNHSPQAESPPSCSLSSVLGETGETKLMTINGPEFSKEKHGSAGLCPRKVSKKASNGLCFMIPGDQRPHHSVAKPWSRCRSGVSQCSNAVCIHVKLEWL